MHACFVDIPVSCMRVITILPIGVTKVFINRNLLLIILLANSAGQLRVSGVVSIQNRPILCCILQSLGRGSFASRFKLTKLKTFKVQERPRPWLQQTHAKNLERGWGDFAIDLKLIELLSRLSGIFVSYVPPHKCASET